MNEIKSIPFWRQIWLFCTDFSSYRLVLGLGKKELVTLFFQLTMLYALVTGSILTFHGYRFIQPILQELGTQTEKIVIADSVLESEPSKIQVTSNEYTYPFTIVIDSELSKEMVSSYVNPQTIQVIAYNSAIVLYDGQEKLWEQPYTIFNEPLTISGSMLLESQRSLGFFLFFSLLLLQFFDGVISNAIVVGFFTVIMGLFLPWSRLPLQRMHIAGLAIFALAPAIIYPSLISIIGLGNQYIESIVYVVFLWFAFGQFKPQRIV